MSRVASLFSPNGITANGTVLAFPESNTKSTGFQVFRAAPKSKSRCIRTTAQEQQSHFENGVTVTRNENKHVSKKRDG